MAAVYKCTKLTVLGRDPAVGGNYLLKCDFINPTLPDPPLQFVTISMEESELTSADEQKTQIDAALALVGANTMDWTL